MHQSQIQLASATPPVGKGQAAVVSWLFPPAKARGAHMRGHTQLTRSQRYQIEALLEAGHTQTDIAKSHNFEGSSPNCVGEAGSPRSGCVLDSRSGRNRMVGKRGLGRCGLRRMPHSGPNRSPLLSPGHPNPLLPTEFTRPLPPSRMARLHPHDLVKDHFGFSAPRFGKEAAICFSQPPHNVFFQLHQKQDGGGGQQDVQPYFQVDCGGAKQ